MYETTPHHNHPSLLSNIAELAQNVIHHLRLERKLPALVAVSALALTGCGVERVEPAAPESTSVSTLNPTATPTSTKETPSPSSTNSNAGPTETASPTPSQSESESPAPSNYEKPPKYDKLKKLSYEKFLAQDPALKSQFLQGIAYDARKNSKISSTKLGKEINDALDAGYAPWMASKQDDPQLLMNRISVTEKLAKALYKAGDRRNAQKVISTLDVRTTGIHDFASSPFFGLGTREEYYRDNVVDPVILNFQTHPEWGGTGPLAFDYRWDRSAGGAAVCVEHDLPRNPDGTLYVFAKGIEKQEGEKEKDNSVMTLGIYAPEKGVETAYYNPTNEKVSDSGKFSMVQYYTVSERVNGLNGFMDDDMMSRITPPLVTDEEVARSVFDMSVICSYSGVQWLWKVDKLK